VSDDKPKSRNTWPTVAPEPKPARTRAHSIEPSTPAGWAVRADYLVQERDAARKALQRYGRHLGDCDAVTAAEAPCSCGLDLALRF